MVKRILITTLMPAIALVALLAVSSPASAADISDEAITKSIQAEVKKHLEIDPENVVVRTKDGVVTLLGSVRTKQQYTTVQEIAAKIPGVKNVRNDMDIKPKVPNK